MWIITVRNWKSAQPSSAHPPPANSNKKLTHLGALFSFSFSLKYSITFFSQSGLTPFWAERKIYFSKLKVQSIIKDISLGCLIGSTVQDARSCRVAGGWILQLGWGRAPAGYLLTAPPEREMRPQMTKLRNHHHLESTLLPENRLYRFTTLLQLPWNESRACSSSTFFKKTFYLGINSNFQKVTMKITKNTCTLAPIYFIICLLSLPLPHFSHLSLHDTHIVYFYL